MSRQGFSPITLQTRPVFGLITHFGACKNLPLLNRVCIFSGGKVAARICGELLRVIFQLRRACPNLAPRSDWGAPSKLLQVFCARSPALLPHRQGPPKLSHRTSSSLQKSPHSGQSTWLHPHSPTTSTPPASPLQSTQSTAPSPSTAHSSAPASQSWTWSAPSAPTKTLQQCVMMTPSMALLAFVHPASFREALSWHLYLSRASKIHKLTTCSWVVKSIFCTRQVPSPLSSRSACTKFLRVWLFGQRAALRVSLSSYSAWLCKLSLLMRCQKSLFGEFSLT